MQITFGKLNLNRLQESKLNMTGVEGSITFLISAVSEPQKVLLITSDALEESLPQKLLL